MDFVSMLKTAVGLLEAAITARCDTEANVPPMRQTKAVDAYMKYKRAITHLLDVLAVHDDPFVRTQLELAFVEAEEMRRLAMTELPADNTGLGNLERRFRAGPPPAGPPPAGPPPAGPPPAAPTKMPNLPEVPKYKIPSGPMPAESFPEMPNLPEVPKYKIRSGPIANKFVALFRKIYEERLNGNPLFVFVVFLNTLINEMSEMSILRDGLVKDKDRLIEMTKMNPSDTPAQINAKFVKGTNFMYEILNKIEMQKHMYKKVNMQKMQDEDLLRIFYNIVSGGSELEKRQKRLQYGEWDWSQRGGKRKTLRRRKNRCMTRRK